MTLAQVCSFIALLLLPGCSGEGELPPDPHAFGRTIVSALKEADADAYEQLIYTKQDVEYMLDHRAAANRDDESYRKGWLESYDRRREEIERSFDRIHREAKRHGLSDWSDVTFKTVDFKTVREGDFTRYEMIVEVSTDDGREYVLTDATCWKTDRGLALQSPPTILTQKGRQGLGR